VGPAAGAGLTSGPDRVHELGDDDTISRRRELLGLGSLMLCAVVGASLRADLLHRPGVRRPLVDPGWLRSATVALASASCSMR